MFAGDVRGIRTHPETTTPATTTTPRSSTPSPTRQITVRQTLHLDSFELFTQLCASTALVLANGPLGFIHSSVPLSNGIIRVWRRFLAEACLSSGSEAARECETASGNERASGTERTKESEKERPLWVNDGENVGVKFTVRKLGDDLDDFIEGDDDEEDVSYEIRYDELHVRSLHLLLAVEKSMQLQSERDASIASAAMARSAAGMAAGMDAGMRGTVLFGAGAGAANAASAGSGGGGLVIEDVAHA
ncbi:MAG: hypothetical protein INR71_14185 [Terriglobus roseus]|nr:hypothetical protein [Terriglobus roseus]